ncbi:Chondroitin synthase [compost metagenome]
MLKYDHELNMSDDNSVSMILRKIKPGSTVLEFGPATGYMTKYLKNELNCRVYCVEVDSESAAISSEYAEKMIVADLDFFEWLSPLESIRFDFIVFADVLEHLKNPWEVLKVATTLLKSDGQLLTSIPNIGHNSIIMELLQGKFEYRNLGLLDNTHLRFFTKNGILKMLDYASLASIELTGTVSPPELTEFQQNLDSFPLEMQNFLINNVEGYVYQYVVTAKRKEDVAPEEVSEVLNVSKPVLRPSKTQVYWDTGNGLNEKQSVELPFEEGNTTQNVNIQLPEGTKVIRIDPTDIKSFVEIYDITLSSGSTDIHLEKLEWGFNEQVTVLQQKDNSIHLLSLGDDPQVIVSSKDESITFTAIEFKIKYSKNAFENVLREIDTFSSNIDDYNSKLKTLECELDRSQEMVRDLEQNNKHLNGEKERLIRESELQTQIMNDKENQLESQNKQLELQKQQLESQKQQIESQKEIIENVEQKLVRKQELLDQMLSSSSWKITKPLRLLGQAARNPKKYIKRTVNTLIRKTFVPELVPVVDLEKDKGSEGWHAIGPDPQFLVKGSLPEGWTKLKYDLTGSDTTFGQMQLYLDTGDYFNERQTVMLGKIGQGQVYVPLEGVLQLRFDPIDREGEFIIREFSLKNVSWIEVKSYRTLVKLRNKINKYTNFGLFAWEKFKYMYKKRGRLPKISEIYSLARKAKYQWSLENGHGDALITPPAGFQMPDVMEPYDAWLEVNHWNSRREKLLEQRLQKLERNPLISIVMPVYNPPVRFLNRAIETVVEQIYENWELLIADDASTDPEVKKILMEWAQKDSRIKLSFLEKNSNISVATNTAAANAQGEFILLMDNDDELTIDALGEVACYLNEHPETDVLYSDDDKIDIHGNRFDPQFKPDWSPELLMSFMYFSHLFVVSTHLYKEVGGMRKGFEGSQDYDFALRVTEKARSVGHIPKILYHWRVLPNSTASNGGAKPESFEAGRKAVEEAVERRGLNASAYQPDWALKAGCGIFDLRFPDNGPSVSIIIPTKNQVEILKKCIDSIENKTTYQNYQIVVIDNDSDDPQTIKYMDKLKHKVLKISNPNGKFSYAYINNKAVSMVDTDYVLFLNNDTEVVNGQWLSQMVGYLGISGVGAVGARLLFPDGRIQHAGITHGYYNGFAGPSFKLLPSWNNGYLSLANVSRNTLAVTAACLLTPRDLFMELNGFDELDFAVAYNDVDYCYRVHDAGYRLVYCPSAELIHYEGYSRGFADNPAEGAAFRRKYRNVVDPFYNPNLSLDNEQFQIASKTVNTGEVTDPIRVLMGAFNLNWEGAPYSQYEMTVYLKENGIIDPVVFSPTDGPLKQMYEEKGIQVIVSQHPLAGVFELDSYKKSIDILKNKLFDWNIELVYGNTLQTFYFIAAAKEAGLPSILNPRESEPWQTYFNHFGPEIAREALETFSYPYKVIFVANATRDGVLPLNAHYNFTTIHNGLDIQRFNRNLAQWTQSSARAELGIEEDKIVLLLLGTVSERKGQIDLIRAVKKLDKDTRDKIVCYIVGDRPSAYSDRLHAEANSDEQGETAECFKIIPETSETALFYSAADIFVCTSRVESFPRVILEAMACGLPVVTTPVFGISEQVQNGVNGLFYQPGDIDAMAGNIEKLLDSPALRANMASNSKYVIEMLNDYRTMAESYGEIFKEAWISGGSR